MAIKVKSHALIKSGADKVFPEFPKTFILCELKQQGQQLKLNIGSVSLKYFK